MATSTGLSDKVRESITCPICIRVFKNPMTLVPCAHKVCQSCIRKMKQTSQRSARRGSGQSDLSCPTCRKPIESHHLDHTMRNLVEMIRENNGISEPEDSEDEEEDQTDVVQRRKHTGARQPTAPPANTVRVRQTADQQSSDSLTGGQLVGLVFGGVVGGLLGGMRGAMIGGGLGAAILAPDASKEGTNRRHGGTNGPRQGRHH
eukprot:scpid89033/ scgid33276/ Tripartite motif-containing protein 5; TRIM5alpha